MPNTHTTVRAVLVGFLLLGAAVGAAASAVEDPTITIDRSGATCVISARFTIPESPSLVRGVLTDYESIPSFMPGVRTSHVLERRNGHVRLEQDSVSRFLFFSKRVHLELDVEEGADVIRFRDLARTSFRRYQGSWSISTDGEQTEVDYELIAQPVFGVPRVVLGRLLHRQARVMIDHLRSELHARAVLRSQPPAARPSVGSALGSHR